MHRNPVTMLCANGCGATCEGTSTYREISMPIPGTIDGRQPSQVRYVVPTDATWRMRSFAPQGPGPIITNRHKPGTAEADALGSAQGIANATRAEQSDWVCAACALPESKPA